MFKNLVGVLKPILMILSNLFVFQGDTPALKTRVIPFKRLRLQLVARSFQ